LLHEGVIEVVVNVGWRVEVTASIRLDQQQLQVTRQQTGLVIEADTLSISPEGMALNDYRHCSAGQQP